MSSWRCRVGRKMVLPCSGLQPLACFFFGPSIQSTYRAIFAGIGPRWARRPSIVAVQHDPDVLRLVFVPGGVGISEPNLGRNCLCRLFDLPWPPGTFSVRKV